MFSVYSSSGGKNCPNVLSQIVIGNSWDNVHDEQREHRYAVAQYNGAKYYIYIFLVLKVKSNYSLL